MASAKFFSLLIRRASSASSAGVALSLATIVALCWSAASPASYRGFTTSSSTFVFDVLMTLFFLVIGLDLGHELSDGFLRDARHSLPALSAAGGGMIATSGCALLLGWLFREPLVAHSWGVPMATDIAFALAALSLAGENGNHLRHFVLVLAVADDIGSVIVLAITGQRALAAWWLGGAFAAGVLTVWLRRRIPLAGWLVVEVALWWLFHRAGIEAPLSGVLTGICIPTTLRARFDMSFRSLTAGVNLLVLPLFALVATGVIWTSVSAAPHATALAAGLTAARIVGKVAGITLGALLMSRLTGIARPPVKDLVPVGFICAMGVTVPLIFAREVFGNSPAYSVTTATLLGVTVLSGAVGVVLIRRQNR